MKNRTSAEPSTPTAPACWQRENSSSCLRIELPNGQIHLLPYSHLISALLTRTSGNNDSLQITFSAHEVQIEGHNLRDLLHGIQDFAIKWLRSVPEKYAPIAIDCGVISSIHVAALE